MELVDVASFFDKIPARDPVSGALLFHCQILAFDESKRDAYTAYRRILSVHPDTVVPVGRVISAYGTKWMIGEGQSDGWENEHRRKHVLHKVTGQVSVYRLSGFLTGTPAAQVWGDIQWVADKKEMEVSSRTPQKFAAILPSSTTVQLGDVIVLGETTVLVGARTAHASGFVQAEGTEQWMPDAASVTLTTRTYSPAAGGYTSPTNTTVSAWRVRWQDMFAYDDQLDERYQEGDCTWVLPASATVSTATEITYGAFKYTVLAIREEFGCKLIHARQR